jgi:hypothetical protein
MEFPTTGDAGIKSSATEGMSDATEVGDVGVVGDATESAPGDAGEPAASLRLIRECDDRPLFPDFTETASPLSSFVSPFERSVELLGLSVLPFPGILDRMEVLSEREDSFVSDLIIGGPAEVESLAVELPLEGPGPPSLELAFPIARCRGFGVGSASSSGHSTARCQWKE